MEIIIRKMLETELSKVKKIAKETFVGVESLVVDTPTNAMVAEVDGEIVGAIIYKQIITKNIKSVYIEKAFIQKDYQAKGIGKKLYKETFEKLKQEYDYLTSLVKDDNAASWKLFLENDFKRTNIINISKIFGIKGMIKHYISTPWSLAIGVDYYISSEKEENNENIEENDNTNKNIAVFLGINILNVIIMQLIYLRGLNQFILAYMLVLLLIVASGYIGVKITKQKCSFRFTDGGLMYVIIAGVFGFVFPAIGNWYPKKYENTEILKRNLAIISLIPWIFMILLVMTFKLFNIENELFASMQQIASLFLMLRIITIYPSASFGGLRVFNYKKSIWAMLILISTIMLVI